MRKTYLYILIFTISLAFGSIFRLYPLYSSISSDSYERAIQINLKKLKHKKTTFVEKTFPNLSKLEKNNKINEIIKLSLKKDDTEFKKNVRKTAHDIKNNFDDDDDDVLI